MLDGRSIARKIFHFSGASIPLCYLLFGKTAALVFASILFIVSASFEFLRIRGRAFRPLIGRIHAFRATGLGTQPATRSDPTATALLGRDLPGIYF